VEAKEVKRKKSEYEKFMDAIMPRFRRLFAQGIAEQFAQSAFYKASIIKIEDKVSKLTHAIVLKFSERKWPVPPSLADQYLERTWQWVTRIYPSELMQRSDFTVFLIGNLTHGVAGKSYVTKRLSGKSTLVYYVQKRRKAIREIIRKIFEIINRYYTARLRRIHEVKRQLEERGLDTSFLDLNRIEAFLTLLSLWLTNILQEV